MNVLVLEDDRRIASLLERGLTENGHQVSVSANGRDGAQMMMDGGYDAALLDIMLPGMDGLAVLHQGAIQALQDANHDAYGHG